MILSRRRAAQAADYERAAAHFAASEVYAEVAQAAPDAPAPDAPAPDAPAPPPARSRFASPARRSRSDP